MSALASNRWESRSEETVAAMPFPGNAKETAMRERMSALRDTLLVLGLQLVFRATLIMRRWNY
ncbi:MAG: hypothetical protein ACRD59_17230 [Candidatus Acidiferrales bacterium]